MDWQEFWTTIAWWVGGFVFGLLGLILIISLVTTGGLTLLRRFTWGRHRPDDDEPI